MRDYLSVVVVEDLDWDVAESVLQTVPEEVRDERADDLAQLRRLLTVDEYRRFASSCGEAVGVQRLYIAAPHGQDEWPDVAVSIARLAADGLLASLGVVAWSTPQAYKRPG